MKTPRTTWKSPFSPSLRDIFSVKLKRQKKRGLSPVGWIFPIRTILSMSIPFGIRKLRGERNELRKVL